MTFIDKLQFYIEAYNGAPERRDNYNNLCDFLVDHADAIANLCETVSLYVNKINAPEDHPLRVALSKLEGL